MPNNSSRIMNNNVWLFTLVLLCIENGQVLASLRDKLPNCSDSRSNPCYPYIWQSIIYTEFNETVSTLTVQFSHAPQATKLDTYNVTLKNNDYNMSNKTKLKKVVFRNVCSGKYSITVKPVDPYPSVKGKCLCYMSYGRCRGCQKTIKEETFGTGDNTECKSPTVIRSVTKEPSKSTSTTSSTAKITTTGISTQKATETSPVESSSRVASMTATQLEKNVDVKNKTQTIMWAALGSSIALLLAFTFICFMCRTRENLTDKKILFLYSHDHQHHLDVGKALAAYLQHSKCQLLYPPLFAEEEIKQWLHKTVADCDFVLLLHSECIKRQSGPWINGLEYPQLRDNRNENVLMSILTMIRECPLLQLYHSKYISCHLEHLSDNFILSEFASVQNFTLIRDLKKLVYYIHRIPTNSIFKSLTIPLRASESAIASIALQQAAQKAAEFEKNKMWFIQKYSYLVPRCGLLNDKCDCRSSLNDEADITKMPVNCYHDFNYDDSVSKQCLYFNDINSYSEMSQVSSELAMLNDRNDQQYKNRYSHLPSLSEGLATDCVSNWTDITYLSSNNNSTRVNL